MFSDNQPDDRAYRTKKRLVLLALVILFMLSAAGALVMSRLVTPIPVPATQPLVQILTPPVRGVDPAAGATTAAALGPLAPSATATPTRNRQGTADAGSSPTSELPETGTPGPIQTEVNKDEATPIPLTPTTTPTSRHTPADLDEALDNVDETTPIPLTPTIAATAENDRAAGNEDETTSMPPTPTIAATAENDRAVGNEEAALISPTPVVTAASGHVPAATGSPANDIDEITQVSPTPALTAEAGNDTGQAAGPEEPGDDGGISPNGLPVTGMTTRPALYHPANLGLALGTIVLLLAAGFAAVHRIEYK